MKDALLALRAVLGLAYWVRISTESPQCVYFFGPFASAAEADAHVGGYREDLEGEGAQNIAVKIERCKPKQLTITTDWGGMEDTTLALSSSPAYSS